VAVANAWLSDLTDNARLQVESLLLSFDQSWSPDRLAEQVRTLPAVGNPLRLAALIELVKVDLERHWQHGRPLHVEDYLARYPELGTADTVAPDLLQTEYEVRQQFGQPADLTAFAARFPLRADALRRLIEPADEAAEAISQPGTVEMRSVETSKPADVPASVAPPELPEQFGRYLIVRKLGQGSMGTVYLAHDRSLDRPVALKVPRLRVGDDHKVLERFYQEARAAATLEHPNLCPIYDVGAIDGTPYLTMAFVEGCPLSEVIRDDQPLEPARAVALVHQLAVALQVAHARGVIHRDLKPSNVMLNRRGEPVVMDFGLARRAQSGEARLTHDGSLVGTPAYMPPEQVQGQVDVQGPACDIYALGVILYEALTGRLPFQGPVMAVLAQIISEEPAPLRQLRPDLDPALERICLKAMAKKPEERYASMSALAADLAACLHGGAPTAGAGRRPPRRRQFVIGAAAGGLAAALVAIIILLRHPNGTTTQIEVPAGSTVELRPDGKQPADTRPAPRPPDERPQTPRVTPAGPYALRFNGRSSRVRIPRESFSYSGTYSLTIEATVVPHTLGTRQVILCDFEGTVKGGSGIQLSLLPTRRWVFGYRAGKGGKRDEVVHPSPAAIDRRVHLAAVLDRGQNKLRLFVDGKLAGAETIMEYRFKKSPYETILGADPNYPGDRFSHFFDGAIEQLRISSVARYARDYVPAAVLDRDADTVILYLFNEGEGHVLHDVSGHKRDALIIGAIWERCKPSRSKRR
jgi:hypothetical protein